MPEDETVNHRKDPERRNGALHEVDRLCGTLAVGEQELRDPRGFNASYSGGNSPCTRDCRRTRQSTSGPVTGPETLS